MSEYKDWRMGPCVCSVLTVADLQRVIERLLAIVGELLVLLRLASLLNLSVSSGTGTGVARVGGRVRVFRGSRLRDSVRGWASCKVFGRWARFRGSGGCARLRGSGSGGWAS